MSSEINNNLTLSTTMPVSSDAGSQNNSTQVVQFAKSSQNGANVPSLTAVKAAAEQSNPLLQATNLSVEYSVDSATKEMVIKVVDTSGKLVRQIPSAEMLDFVKRLQDMENKQNGTVIQTSA
ncbi:MAG: flagellar protein FlaG [Methylomonas sp.]|jgi:flagellar protein FlaG